jgi:hypothetical protein
MRHLLSLSGASIAPAQAAHPVIEGRGAASAAPATASGVGHIRHHVFLAYRHPDESYARTVYRELLAAGHRVWMDMENLLPGQMWLAELKSALARASAFVVLLSGQTSADHSFVLKEFELAQSRLRQGLRVIPVRLEPVALPAGFKDYQAVDLFMPDGLQRLLSALDSHAA